jgi:hypothetical protein
MQRPKNKKIYSQEKSKAQSPLNRKGNKRLSKKNDQWHPISKRWTPNTWHILKHLALIKFNKEISTMTIEINNHWSNNRTSIIDWHKCFQPTQ